MMSIYTPAARGRRSQGLSALLMVFLCALACSGSQNPPEAAPLHLRIGTALPSDGVPRLGVRELVLGLFGETILAPDRSGRTRPRLCDDWEWLNDGRVLKLTIKKGIRFHDGLELTADSAAELLRTEFKRRDPPPSYQSVGKIEATDSHTLLVHLRRPEAFLPEDLTDVRMIRGTIGTGPFVLNGPLPGRGDKSASLHVFDAYHQGRPQVRRVDLTAYPTLRGAWTAMMRGEINMLYEVGSEAAAFVEAESSVRNYPFLRPYTILLAFNMRHPALGRKDVRQAINEAVDRQAIIREGMGGQGEPADGPIWKYHWAYSTAQRTHAHNPEAARLRLDSAGFRQPGATGSRSMPSRFSFRCLMFGDDPRFEGVALVLQKQLYEIGVDMQIEAVPLNQMLDRMANGRFDAFFFEMISSRSLTWTYRIWHSRSGGRWFDSGYTATDDALDRLREAFTEVETRAAISELQRVLYEEPPALFLAWPQINRAVSADITVAQEANLDIFGRVWNFRRATATQARQ